MTTKNLQRQVRDLLESLPVPPADSRPLMIIASSTWPDDVLDRYLMACAADDRDTQYALIEQQTGQRPSERPDEVVIINVQIDRDLVGVEVVG